MPSLKLSRVTMTGSSGRLLRPHFISSVTQMENDLLFCSKLMFTNGKIVVKKKKRTKLSIYILDTINQNRPQGLRIDHRIV
jgi:hypothetical protein